MQWLELSVKTPAEFVEPLSNIFYSYGHGGVVVEEDVSYSPDEGEVPSRPALVTLRTYLPLNSTTQERRSRIDLGVRLVAHLAAISPLQEKVVSEDEWEKSWKAYFQVLHVGEQITICPSWQRYAPGENEIVITLDPGMAFGTGHHPTTRMCLELLERNVRPGMDVLDVGCGSGILSVAAAKLGARRVLGLEVDSVAVGVATQNFQANGIAPFARVNQGTLPHPDVPARSYHLAVANISAKVILSLAGELVGSVAEGGKLIISGILEDHRDSILQAMTAAGARPEHELADGDWIAMLVGIP